MGTSRGISTGSGGAWTGVKREINITLDEIGTAPGPTVHDEGTAAVVQSVMRAIGGLGLGIPALGDAGGGRSGSAGRTARRGGGGGSRARASSTRSKSVGRAVAGLGGFGVAVRDVGLTEALRQLDLGDLEGRSAVEVIARVADRLSEGNDGIDVDLLRTALNEAILEVSQLEEEVDYTDLEAGLQSFLNSQGIEGLVSTFLGKLVTDLVTASICQHVDVRTQSEAQIEAFLAGVEAACRSKANDAIAKHRADGRFNQIDWFGTNGARLGREVANTLLAELGIA